MLFLFSAFTCNQSSLCVSMMQLLLTCFERVGVVRWTRPLSAGAEHPELVLWSWAETVNGYDINTIWERVPVASVFTRTLTHAGARSGTYTHFDPIDHAQLWTLEVQVRRVCAHWKRNCYLNWHWICKDLEYYNKKNPKHLLDCSNLTWRAMHISQLLPVVCWMLAALLLSFPFSEATPIS